MSNENQSIFNDNQSLNSNNNGALPQDHPVVSPVLNPTTISQSPYRPTSAQTASAVSTAAAPFTPSPVLTPVSSAPVESAPVLTPETASLHTTSPSTVYAATSSAALPATQELSKEAKKAAKEEKNAAKRELKAARHAEKASKGGSSMKRTAAIVVCSALIGGMAAIGGLAIYTRYFAPDYAGQAAAAAKKAVAKELEGKSSSDQSSSTKATSTVYQGNRDYTVLNTSLVDTSEKHTASEIYAANVNSTVGIVTSLNYNYYGYETTAAAAGSGFILTEDGYIVTNHHVIDDANSIQVTLYDGTSYEAELIGYDESNDLAVLKIDAEGLTPVILGDSDNLNVGDDVVAIGNPLGELTFSLTKGCVSALDRTVTINNQPMSLMQTDCAINSGNSGGALFNMYGEVIGITNAKYSNNGEDDAAIESIGFAIPINSVRGIINSIIEEGCISKPYIGVYVETITSKTNYGADKGIGINDVIADSPAEKAGLKAKDAIIKIDGVEVSQINDLKKCIEKAGIGGQLTLTIVRDGKEIEIVVNVEESRTSALG